MIVRAARALLADGLHGPVAVEMDGDHIVDVVRSPGPAPEVLLAPGFVDLQVNGGPGVDVAGAGPEGIAALSLWLAEAGVTTWLPTLITTTPDRQQAWAARLEAMRRGQGASATAGARIGGLHLEGPMLGGRPGAHPAELVRSLSLAEVAGLPAGVRLVTLAPEAPGALEIIAALVARGITVGLGHTTADNAQLDAARAAGARLVTHVFNGMPPFHHRAPGPAGWALTTDGMAVSVVADGWHVDPRVLLLTSRAKPAGDLVLVSDAVAFDVGHRPGQPVRLQDATIAGSTIRLDAAVRLAVHSGVEPEVALRAATRAPAALVGLGDRGEIAAGRRADLVALTSELEVAQVWIGGEEVRR